MSDYKRLTERADFDKNTILIKEFSKFEDYVEYSNLHAMEAYKNILNRLAELEDKIEQGTLKEISYPCSFGDKVFVIRSATSNGKNLYITEEKVEALAVSKSEFPKSAYLRIDFFGETSIHEWDFDKVFLTREEAEKKLEELNGNK